MIPPGSKPGEAFSVESASQETPPHVHSDAGFERMRESVIRGGAHHPGLGSFLPTGPAPDRASTCCREAGQLKRPRTESPGEGREIGEGGDTSEAHDCDVRARGSRRGRGAMEVSKR